MAEAQDQGTSPAPETGVTDNSGSLSGDQLFNELLKREQPAEVEVEEAEVPESETVEVPESEEITEDKGEEVQPEETEDEPETPEPEDESSLTDDEGEEESEQRVPYKRLSKEVARRKDLEERLKKAQDRIANLEQAPQEQAPQQTASNVLPDINDPVALQKLEGDTRAAIDYLEEALLDDPNAVTDDGESAYKIQGEFYTPKDLRRMLLNARKRLDREIPTKKQFIQQRANIEAQARETFTWMADRNSQEYQTYKGILSGVQGLESYVGAPALAAAAVEGMRVAYERRTGVAKKTVKRETPPPVSTAESAPRVRVKDPAAERRRVAQASESKLTSKGSLSGADLQRVFELRQRR